MNPCIPIIAAIACITTGATAIETHDPNRTATIYVHGFDPDGAEMTGVFGEDMSEPLLAVIADMAGIPLLGGDPLPINSVAGTTYYGDTPPDYYSAADIAELDAITAAWGGGMPRYAFIIAKYARNVMQRTGASQVNIVSASMGTYVARWLITHDSDGLASEGTIARWLSLEGVLAGHWAATNDTLSDLWDEYGTPSIDVDQMHYDWCNAQYGDRLTMDSALFGDILVGMEISTRDTEGDLTNVMLLVNDFHANDGVVTAAEAWYHTVTPQSQFMGHEPTRTYFHVNHYELAEHSPGMAQIASFLTGTRRVRIELTDAQIQDMHEPDNWAWDWTPAEIVFTSSVIAPAADTLWGITEPVCDRQADGVASPIHEVGSNGDSLQPDHLVYDDFPPPGETTLNVTVGAVEIDDDLRYGVFEPLIGDGWDELGEDTIAVNITTPGVTYQSINAPDFSGTLRIEVIEYPFPELTNAVPGDVDGDGIVGVDDLLSIIAAWGPCSGCIEDINGDGFVDVNDLLAALAAWTG
ncbi:MAG: hypothetical protein GY876_05375 [Planctomycetes bacterium]|nr:hypothetical protein [Planctomycetota bacterium]